MESKSPSMAARLWRIAVSLIPFLLLGYYFWYIPAAEQTELPSLVAQFAGTPAELFTATRTDSGVFLFTWGKPGNYRLRIVRGDGTILLEEAVSGSRWAGRPALPPEECYWILLDGREICFAGPLEPPALPAAAGGKLQ